MCIRDSLYARIGSEGPHITFAGHTDVVPPGDETAWTLGAFSGEVKDGFLYGRGAVDMKGGTTSVCPAKVMCGASVPMRA